MVGLLTENVPCGILTTMEFVYNGNSLKSGVYHIRNKINGRRYFGSAKRFKSRWKSHERSLNQGIHHNKFLQSDFNKCGSEAFVFEVLQVVDGEQTERLLIEQRYLDQFCGDITICYNFSKLASSTHPKNPEEVSLRKSESMKKAWQNPEHRKNVSEKCSVAAKKQWECEETRQRMIASVTKASEHLKGVSWGSHSEETKRKISESHKGLSEPYKGRKLSDEQRTSYAARLLSYSESETRKTALRKALCKKLIATSETECLEFDSIVEAAACLELSRSTIRHCLRKGTKAKKQWLFRFVD